MIKREKTFMFRGVINSISLFDRMRSNLRCTHALTVALIQTCTLPTCELSRKIVGQININCYYSNLYLDLSFTKIQDLGEFVLMLYFCHIWQKNNKMAYVEKNQVM